MAGKFNEYNNVDDFIEYKMHRLIDQYAKMNRPDIAKVLSNALDDYLMDKHELVFVNGWPHVVKETVERDKRPEQK